MVLCTGHLSRDEIFALVDGAVGAGIETIVVTHPEFPSQSVAPDDQVELARKGALLERCFTTTHTGKAPWERFYEATRAVGAEHTVWSSDLGQNFNPPVEDGLALMADRFLGGRVQRGRRAHDGGGEHAPRRGAGCGRGDGRLDVRAGASAPARTVSTTCSRCVRIARSAASGSCAATASTTAVCSASDCGRPARGEDRAELEAHELGVQRRGQPDGGLVLRDLEQAAVQAGVDVGDPQEVPGLEQRPHLPQQAAQLGDVAPSSR